jgi:RNA polymerase sigma factor (sigma-70 family)
VNLDSQQQLIAACLAHDRRAQKQLYDQYRRAMFTLAYRVTNDFEVAGEVLQDAFLQVFRGLAGFKGESTLGAWIKTIVVRTAYRAIKTRLVFEELPPQYAETHITWDDALQTDYLEKAIQSLPDGFRTVFTLIEIEGFTHREVGEMLGISEGTSKSQLFFAKKKLKEILIDGK